MHTLEGRYRRLLRLLPAAYRVAWEEEMVAAFLDRVRRDDPEEAEWVASFGRPGRSEVASVVALAARLRLGGVVAPPRSFVWGEAVRRVALVGLLVQAVAATVGVAHQLWFAGWLAWPPLPADLAAIAEPRPLSIPGVLWDFGPALAWAGAYLALVLDRTRVARLLAGLALAPAAVVAIQTWFAPPGRIGLTTGVDLLLGFLVLLALAAFHRDAPRVRRRPWLLAYGAGLAVAHLPALLVRPIPGPVLLDRPGTWSMVLMIAAVAHLAGPMLRGARRAPEWSLALALLAAGAVPLRLASLADHAMSGAGVGTPALAAGLLQAGAVAVAGGVLGVSAARALRALPQGSGWAPMPAPDHPQGP